MIPTTARETKKIIPVQGFGSLLSSESIIVTGEHGETKERLADMFVLSLLQNHLKVLYIVDSPAEANTRITPLIIKAKDDSISLTNIVLKRSAFGSDKLKLTDYILKNGIQAVVILGEKASIGEVEILKTLKGLASRYGILTSYFIDSVKGSKGAGFPLYIIGHYTRLFITKKDRHSNYFVSEQKTLRDSNSNWKDFNMLL